MNIYVCVKHVPDSAANIKILDRIRIDTSITFLLNPYDEHAMTEAVRIKRETGDGEVIAVCLGHEDAEKTIRSAMAMGADRGILIRAQESPDSLVTARVLKAAIEQDGTPDLIFTGKESIDSEGMQTMFRLATLFDFPCATNITNLSIQGNHIRVKTELQGGAYERYELSMPCVLGAGRGLNTPKYPTFPDVVKARKKPVHTMDMDRLLFEKPESGMKILELEPLVRERAATRLTGSLDEIAEQILRILKQEAKVL